MDALVTAVLQSAPSWGVGGLLITYIVILIRREARVDESHAAALEAQAQRHAAEIDALNQRHAAELERVNRDHDVEVAEHQEKVRGLRLDIDDLDQRLSRERANRLGLPTRHLQLGTTLDQDVLDGSEPRDP